MEIALALSGGGYRAAIYHIGVLSYLDSIKIHENESLLDYVKIMSSVSGGSITSLWYIINKSEGINNTESFRNLYQKIVNNDIEKELYDDFIKGATKGNTLIMQLSLIYDRIFFDSKKYGLILKSMQNESFPLHHYAVCATDCNSGRPFHFYASRPITINNESVERFKIGNSGSSIEPFVAEKLHIADIMAASSCFPGIFEPLTYPDDFRFADRTIVEAISKESFSLMDGGIVDNQGVEAISKLEKCYKLKNSRIGLIMVSDVAKANPKKFKRSRIKLFEKDEKLKKSFMKTIPRFIKYKDFIVCIAYFFWIISLLGTLFFKNDGRLACAFIFEFLCCILFVYLYAENKILKLFHLTKKYKKNKYTNKLTFAFNKSFIYELKTNSILEFGHNRMESLYLMVNDIMMGQIRRYKLSQAFGGKRECRTILNAIYALTTKGTWTEYNKKELDKTLRPNIKIRNISDRVADIDTRLCFYPDQIKDGIPKDLLVCGQYTTCWNLLMCIRRLKNNILDETKLNETQKLLIGIEQKLLKDWDEFKEEPYFKSII